MNNSTPVLSASNSVALMGEPMMTLDDLAEYTQTPKSTLYSLRSAGKGPRGCPIGRGIRFRPDDVRAWIEALVADDEA